MDLGIIKLLNDYGAMGVAVFMAYTIWKMSSNHLTHIQKAMEDNNQVLRDLCVAIREFKTYLEVMNKKD